MNRQQLDDIIALVSSRTEPLGYECLEAEWVGSERTLRLYIDKLSEGGVLIDDCLAVNNALKDYEPLDEMIPGSYRLEVSSPGVERPLRSPAHFESSLGKVINVKLLEAEHSRKGGTGKLVAVSAEGMITLESAEGQWSFPISRLKKAHLVFDWGQAESSIQ